MSVANADTSSTAQEATVVDRIADAVRHAAHISHEARLASSIARDAKEEGVYAAKRFVKRVRRGAETLNELKDDSAYYVKRRPFASIGMAAGSGLLIGVVVGWIGWRVADRRRNAGVVDDWKAEIGG